MPKRQPGIWLSLITLSLVAALFWTLARAFTRMEYDWSLAGLGPYLWNEGRPGLLLQGLWGTLYISVLSIVLGTVLGVVVGLMMTSRQRVVRWSALVYVDVFRNTPVLVQLYVAYFVLGTALALTSEQAGILTLSLFCASYVAEIVRGAILNFERGQIEAALSLGLAPWQVARLVVFPQLLRRMLPPLVGQFVTLVKDSSLVSVIGILDVTKAALNVISVTFRSFEVWFLVAFTYLVLNLVVSTLGRALEHRLSRSLRI